MVPVYVIVSEHWGPVPKSLIQFDPCRHQSMLPITPAHGSWHQTPGLPAMASYIGFTLPLSGKIFPI